MKMHKLAPKKLPPIISGETLRHMQESISFLADAAQVAATLPSPTAQQELYATVTEEIAYSDCLTECVPSGTKLGPQPYREELKKYAQTRAHPPHRRLIASYLSMANERKEPATQSSEVASIKTFSEAATSVAGIMENGLLKTVIRFLNNLPKEPGSARESALLRTITKLAM